MIYRLRRFLRTLFPHIQDRELAWARSLLPGEAWSLFRKQSLSEQRHALDVAKDLARHAGRRHPGVGSPVSRLRKPGLGQTGLDPQTGPNPQTGLDPQQIRTLLTAALLHDCGKSRVDIKIKHRVLAVLLSPKASPPKRGPVPEAIRPDLSEVGALTLNNKSGSLLPRLASRSSAAALAWDIYNEHPRWGFDLAVEAGLGEAVQLLILEHHNPRGNLGHLLEQADKRH